MSSAHVSPVTDYEPPAWGARAITTAALPPHPAPPHWAARTPPTQAQSGVTTPAHPIDLQEISLFAEATLRRILEVIDRRRPLAGLRSLLAPGLIDSLLTTAGRRPNSGTAQLRRVHIQLSTTELSTPELSTPKHSAAEHGTATTTAAEVCATYTRCGRTHALACRIEHQPTVTGRRWQVVALHIG